MAAPSSAAGKSSDLVLEITRVFDARLDLVWKAWSEPERMVQWLGPRGFTGEIIRMDTRVGGSYRFHMRSSEGTDHWAQGVYREIVAAKRLVYTWTWTDANGSPVGPETLLTVTFEDLGPKTRLTLRQTGFESVAERDGHRGGWNSVFDRLAEYLAAASPK